LPAAGPTGEDLFRAFAQLRDRPLEEIWPAVLAHEAARAATPGERRAELAEKLPELEGRSRLAAAKFLLGESDRDLAERGQVALLQLAREASDREVRRAAIRLLGDPLRERREAAYLVLRGIADAAADPDLRIEASLSLWRIDNYPPTRKPLFALLNSGAPSERYAAALALAETGCFEKPVVQALEELRKEPSERGRRAGLYLDLRAARDSAAPETLRPEGEAKPPEARPPAGEEPHAGGAPEPSLDDWARAVQEVAREILRSSAYGKSLALRKLYVAAFKGMASAVDEHSAFLDAEDVEELEASQLGTHLGLGAQIAVPGRGAPLVVASVYPSGPAREAGLRAGDQILEVAGVPTAGAPIDRIRALVSVADRALVHLRIQRWDELRPRDVWVRVGEVEVPSVRWEILPEKVGYLKILRFGPGSAAEFERALDRLEASGAEGLVLDLRDNPGGKLEEAVKVVDCFVGKGSAEASRPIVIERTIGGERAWYPDPEERSFRAILVLVNRATASSAEVVAAALQDFAKAAVVGQPTYGKGVKQTAIPLSPRLDRLLGGEGRLLLTTSWLYSPLGRPLERKRAKTEGGGLPREGGVVPDIRTPGPSGALEDEKKAGELARVERSPVLAEFLRAHRERIAQGRSAWDPASEEDFGELAARLGTALKPEEIAAAVRRTALRYLEGDRDERLETKVREDPDLRTAVLEALRRIGRDPASAPFYRE
ncbi:MAG: S41 family peptidase, partial [Planctomycetota bacterium]